MDGIRQDRRVGDTTPPPAPTNVRVSAKGDKGVEITWNAEADFESGIRGFIVLRDGQELAKVPQKPVGKFGRPLFQTMTYHDTPTKPLPEMRYLDASAKPGEKHTYAVITVNSVGLKSELSGKATPQKEPPARGAEGLVPFDGEKSSWHGFDRYDFLMDETDLTIKPYKVAPDEKNAIKAQVKGQRRCVVVVPKASGARQPVVLAGLLLGPRAADRSRAAQARVPYRVCRTRRRRARQSVGHVVQVPDGEAWASEEGRLHRDEQRRGE